MRRVLDSKACPICSELFEITTQRRDRVYCSRKCSGIGRSHHAATNCAYCNKTIEGKRASHITRKKFCNRDCMFNHRQGSNHPMYKGGTVVYRGRNWTKQKRLALKRDGYRCQICHAKLGVRDWDHAVHHIKPYRLFDHDYKTANQLSNLIALCNSCHRKVEVGGLACPIPLI